ncbi:MAG TPA: hypothetical protein VNZ57_03465 [Longimicrobiales bacterium]|nr:hypothetical protein [Longimicrobiales bacterium]
MSLGFYWEQADVDGSDEHPLERELGMQLDALARFGRLIDEAQRESRDGQVAVLLKQQARVEEWVRSIRSALARCSAPFGRTPT